jgi:hypothetical protein
MTTIEENRQNANTAARTASGQRARTMRKLRLGGGVLALCWAAAIPQTAVADQPVYIIAHRCNDVGDVPAVLQNQGVNAIEADFSWGRPNLWSPRRWVVDHDFVVPTSTQLDPWLTDVAAAINAPGSPLSLLILDIKDPDGPLLDLYNKVRAKLGPNINLIFSIADYPSRNYFTPPFVDALNNDPRAGADMAFLDEADNETQFMVRDFFESIGMKRYWYGDGWNIAAVTPQSVITNVNDGISLRDSADVCESYHGVYTWTYEKSSSIKSFLDKGVNGILVNSDECHDLVGLAGVWEAKQAVAYAKQLPGRKFATITDNPFEHMGVNTDFCIGPDLELSKSQFYLTSHAPSAGTSTVVLPVPAPPAPGPFSFNTAASPFVLPCDLDNFGGQMQANLLSSTTPVYWQGDVRFYNQQAQLIVGHGYSGSNTFDHAILNVSAILNPGASALAGFTPISSVNQFRDWMWQPSDLPANTAVRMEWTLGSFADAGFTQALTDSHPENNVANVWLMRVCAP